jgi:hypothetical protein
LSLVFRIDVYLGERDAFGVGFPDNVVFRKQYYVQAFPGSPPEIFIHTGEFLAGPRAFRQDQLRRKAAPGARSEIQTATPVQGSLGEWLFEVAGTGFEARFRVSPQPEAPSSP